MNSQRQLKSLMSPKKTSRFNRRYVTLVSHNAVIKPVPSWYDSMQRLPAEQSVSEGKPMRSRGKRSRECSYK